jgi:hypothetical protein
MDYFAEDKADQLKRIWPLRIMNTLGMVVWHKDSYGRADKKNTPLAPFIMGLVSDYDSNRAFYGWRS